MTLIDQIKDRARGSWLEIITQLTGVSPDYFSGKHGPCPRCEAGKDRFRALDDFTDTGGVVCSTCGVLLADGIATLGWLRNITPQEAIARLAVYLDVYSTTALQYGTPDNRDKVATEPTQSNESDLQVEHARQLRHHVYSVILSLLSKTGLSSEHRQALHRRGLMDAAIQECGYFTLSNNSQIVALELDEMLVKGEIAELRGYSFDDLLTVVAGLSRDRDGSPRLPTASGILIPVRDAEGRIQALKIRRDDTDDDSASSSKGWSRYIYFSSSRACREERLGRDGVAYSKAQHAVHVPLIKPRSPGIIRLTEGELKADAATLLSGVLTVSVPGVQSWERALPVLRVLGAHKVFVALDADHRTNPAVATAVRGLIRLCAAEGYQVALEVWDAALGKGIDDLLKNGHEADVLEGKLMEDYLATQLPIITDQKAHGSDMIKHAASRPWPDIQSFDSIDVPTFPLEGFPTVLRNWIEAESEATQTPPDLAGMLALAMIGGTIARRVTIEARTGWIEPTNLYCCVLLEPGNRKSAVFSDAIRPIQNLQKELQKRAAPEIARLKSERKRLEKKLAKYESQAVNEDDEQAAQQATEIAMQLASMPEPYLPRLHVDDATSEKLETMLAEQNGRIISASPEGGVFDLMAGLYKSGIPNLNVYLMGHSGDHLQNDRMSRASVDVERPAITCAYAVQPLVIKVLAANPIFRGRGVLGRYLFAAPQSWIGERQIAPPPMPAAVKEAYEDMIRTLAEDETEATLHLSPEAASAFLDWEREIEDMLRDGREMELIRDWGGKLAGATLRIAAAIHCAESYRTVDVGSQAMHAAINVARYLIPHAHKVLTMMCATDSPAEDDARYVLRWIMRHALTQFSERDVHQHGKSRFRKVSAVGAALLELQQRGYIRPMLANKEKAGRPPSPRYEVNPAALGGQDRSHNSQNSGEEAA